MDLEVFVLICTLFYLDSNYIRSQYANYLVGVDGQKEVIHFLQENRLKATTATCNVVVKFAYVSRKRQS